jgi:predicted transcriptional regulator
MERLSKDFEDIIQLLIEEKTYKEIQHDLNLRQGELQFRMRLLRKVFGVKSSVGLVVKYISQKNERV